MKKKVFFNASVILAGLKSPRGGSAKVLEWVKNGKIKGFTSEIVVDEVERNLEKLDLRKQELEKLKRHFKIVPAPKNLEGKYLNIAKDIGDTHLFVIAELIKADYLVSLDQKYVLSLAKKVEEFKILSPGSLIQRLRL